MHSLTGQLAAVMASTDAVPRLVRQFTALFLVSPKGDVWRIFDSDDANGESRYEPGNDTKVRARVFIGSGAQPVVRIHEFKPDEPRSVTAETLYEQLLVSKLIG